jgi:tol-pal system protein YbgF
MKKFLMTLALTSLVTAPLFSGTKEEIIRLQSDVLQLQDLIRVLQKTMDERNGMIVSLLEQLNDQAAESQVTLRQFDTQFLSAKTQSSSLEKAIEGMRRDLETLSAKLDETNNRVASIHRRVDESQMQIQTLRTAPSGTPAEVDPDRAYSAYYNDYLMGNFALAINGFQDFLANYPDSELADNAAYYLGDSYLKQGRHELAVQTFDQVINLYPKGDKTPVAYYKKATALEQMQKIEDAVAALRQLQKLYPKSHEATLAQQELERLGIGS